MPASRILILGATGGLGRTLQRALAHTHEVTAWGRAELDLERPEDIAGRLARLEFDVLLNTAGMTSPDACEDQPERARLANAAGPQALAEYCRQRGARLVHFSTDYVFSGEPHGPWAEEDETSPINVYGRSKRAGEEAVLRACPSALVARVSWLFGPDKASHPDHMLQRALHGDDLAAVADKVSAPTSNADIAEWIGLLLREHPGAAGVLHLCNSGAASWHSWAETTLGIARRLGLPVKTTRVRPIKLAELAHLKAPRPLETVMSNTRLQNLLGREIRSWSAALEDYLAARYQSAAAAA